MLAELILLVHLIVTEPRIEAKANVVLASHSISLENRYRNSYVNNVFKDNILLALNYMEGEVKDKASLNWENVEKPNHFEFTLKPGEKFAFHNEALPEYKENVVQTTNSNFGWADGYKSDGYLVGDGVCHFASLIYWAAKDANLVAYAPANHNFATIPDIPKEYGVSIRAPHASQNLYIVNDKDYHVIFAFDYDGENLSVSISKAS